MKLIKHLAFCSLILTLGCKNNKVDLTKNDSLKKSWERNVSVEEANRILDSSVNVKSNDHIKNFEEKDWATPELKEVQTKFKTIYIKKTNYHQKGYINFIILSYDSTNQQYYIAVDNDKPGQLCKFWFFNPTSKEIKNECDVDSLK